jgi:hypothetical protein
MKQTQGSRRMHLQKIKVELAGIYAVAHQLCRQGYLAIPVPSGHYPEVDLVVHDLEHDRIVGIQVKTRMKVVRHHFLPSSSHPTVYVILDPLQFYVLDRKYVSRIIAGGRRGWIPKADIEIGGFKDRWENIWQ